MCSLLPFGCPKHSSVLPRSTRPLADLPQHHGLNQRLRLWRETMASYGVKHTSKGQDISRVLFPHSQWDRGVIIHLGYPLPNTSSGTHQAEQEKDQPLFLDLAPNRGLPSQHLSMLLVRSYRTFAPLPNFMGNRRSPLSSGGMFLWHYPHDCSHWALPSKFDLSGARTFLKPNRLTLSGR